MDGVWASWNLEACTVSCGGGVQYKSRSCITPSDKFDMTCLLSDGTGMRANFENITQECNTELCPLCKYILSTYLYLGTYKQ